MSLPEIAAIKIIFTLFAIFAWSRAFLRFKSKLMNIKELVFWTILWISATVLVFIPGKSDLLANLLGMNRGLDAMFFIGIVALFYAVYRLYAKMANFENEITELVRQIALKQGVSRKKSKK